MVRVGKCLGHLHDHPHGQTKVSLNRAVAAAMAEGPGVGLALLDGLEDRLGDHHRLHAVRAHLLELAGDVSGAVVEFRAAPPAPPTCASSSTW